MDFFTPLVQGSFIERRKRFFVDVQLPQGETITAYCANTGKMTGLLVPESPVFLSPRTSGQGLPYTWQMVQLEGALVGVNTHIPNKIVKQALINRKIKALDMYDSCKSEIYYDASNRFDFFLESTSTGSAGYLEVKNVHLKRGTTAFFPDTVTQRGRKHLETLTAIKRRHPSVRAIVLFVIQRNDCTAFKLAADIDEKYAAAARQALRSGVEFLAYDCKMTVQAIQLNQKIPILDI